MNFNQIIERLKNKNPSFKLINLYFEGKEFQFNYKKLEEPTL